PRGQPIRSRLLDTLATLGNHRSAVDSGRVILRGCGYVPLSETSLSRLPDGAISSNNGLTAFLILGNGDGDHTRGVTASHNVVRAQAIVNRGNVLFGKHNPPALIHRRERPTFVVVPVARRSELRDTNRSSAVHRAVEIRESVAVVKMHEKDAGRYPFQGTLVLGVKLEVLRGEGFSHIRFVADHVARVRIGFLGIRH
ncbi:unnamed protein product, partial [Mycena citricolor]